MKKKLKFIIVMSLSICLFGILEIQQIAFADNKTTLTLIIDESSNSTENTDSSTNSDGNNNFNEGSKNNNILLPKTGERIVNFTLVGTIVMLFWGMALLYKNRKRTQK